MNKNNTPQVYLALIRDFHEEDRRILTKYKGRFNANKDLKVLIELAMDVERRLKVISAVPEWRIYGAKLIPAITTVLGVDQPSLRKVLRIVRLLSGAYLLNFLSKATSKRINVTVSHLHELNRLGKPVNVAGAKTICQKILKGELLTARQVRLAVDAILETAPPEDIQYDWTATEAAEWLSSRLGVAVTARKVVAMYDLGLIPAYGRHKKTLSHTGAYSEQVITRPAVVRAVANYLPAGDPRIKKFWERNPDFQQMLFATQDAELLAEANNLVRRLVTHSG